MSGARITGQTLFSVQRSSILIAVNPVRKEQQISMHKRYLSLKCDRKTMKTSPESAESELLSGAVPLFHPEIFSVEEVPNLDLYHITSLFATLHCLRKLCPGLHCAGKLYPHILERGEKGQGNDAAGVYQLWVFYTGGLGLQPGCPEGQVCLEPSEHTHLCSQHRAAGRDQPGQGINLSCDKSHTSQYWEHAGEEAKSTEEGGCHPPCPSWSRKACLVAHNSFTH